MNTLLTEPASAKINLTLRVRGRRADGYHLLESLVAFAGIADEVSLSPGAGLVLDTSGPFAGASGAPEHNLVLTAAAVFARAIGAPIAGHFRLTKNIPVAAGLGGGSADAAAALRLMARVHGIAPADPRLLSVARSIGADVPVCLDPRARIMRGIGDELSPPLNLPPLAAVLVNPGVRLPTADVFAVLQPPVAGDDALGEVPRERNALIAWLAGLANDLTPAAIVCAPVIADVLASLAALPGTRLARMSGSGATCFALFDTLGEADAATRQLLTRQETRLGGWWVRATSLR